MSFLRLLFICFVFSYGSVCSQNFIRVDADEFSGGTPEGKMMAKNINKAKKLFGKGESAFEECISLLLECNTFNGSNAELNYNIGQAYFRYGKKELAKPYFEKVKDLKSGFNEELYLFLGQACQYEGDFSKAILNYKTYIEILQHDGVKRNTDKLKIANRYVGQCKSGQILSEHLLDFEVEELAYPINSEANDVLAIKDGSKLFFNSDRLIVSDKNKYEPSLRGFSVVLLNGEWSSFSILNDEKKTQELPIMVAKLDANQYLFYDRNIGLGDLIFMQKDEKYWVKEMDVFFVNEKRSNESSASFTADGNTVVFCSDREGGQGDIFYCEKGENGEWSKPQRLDDNINSTFDEKDVFLSEDGKVMYFSSNGRNSIGGYDIFRSERSETGNWMEAKNMGIPINSAYDERHFFPSEGDSFLFDSNRGENGKFDIYSKKLIVEKVSHEVLEEPVKVSEKLEEVIPVEKVEVVPVVIPLPSPVIKKAATLITTYKIQIAASKLVMKESELKKIYQGKSEINHSYDGEWHRYTIGEYDNLEDAIYFKDRSGVRNAFVVSFENEVRKKIISNYGLSNQ